MLQRQQEMASRVTCQVHGHAFGRVIELDAEEQMASAPREDEVATGFRSPQDKFCPESVFICSRPRKLTDKIPKAIQVITVKGPAG